MKQSVNNAVVVGLLKSKEVRYGQNKNGDYISLKLTIESKLADDKVNVQKVECFAAATSKLYKGFQTVVNEYKTIDENGRENADRIKVTGSISLNEYVGNDGEFKSFPKINGIFVNRLDEGNVNPDECGVVLECVVDNVIDEIGKEGLPSGRLSVKILTVGYKDRISEFEDVKVGSDLAPQFKKLFPVGTTAKFSIALYNYAEIDETQQAQESAVPGFGQTFSNIDTTIRNFVNEKVIIGGDMPIVLGAYSKEDIENMKKLREVAKAEIMQTAPNLGGQSLQSGFGSGFEASSPQASTTQSDLPAIDDSDLPF